MERECEENETSITIQMTETHEQDQSTNQLVSNQHSQGEKGAPKTKNKTERMKRSSFFLLQNEIIQITQNE